MVRLLSLASSVYLDQMRCESLCFELRAPTALVSVRMGRLLIWSYGLPVEFGPWEPRELTTRWRARAGCRRRQVLQLVQDGVDEDFFKHKAVEYGTVRDGKKVSFPFLQRNP